jgi:hypothetical protein
LTLHPATGIRAHTGVPESTVRRWLSEGRICKHGTRSERLYDLTEVEQIMGWLGRSYPPPRATLDDEDD